METVSKTISSSQNETARRDLIAEMAETSRGPKMGTRRRSSRSSDALVRPLLLSILLSHFLFAGVCEAFFNFRPTGRVEQTKHELEHGGIKVERVEQEVERGVEPVVKSERKMTRRKGAGKGALFGLLIFRLVLIFNPRRERMFFVLRFAVTFCLWSLTYFLV